MNKISQNNAIENPTHLLNIIPIPIARNEEFSNLFEPGLSDTEDEVADSTIVLKDLGTEEQANDVSELIQPTRVIL